MEHVRHRWQSWLNSKAKHGLEIVLVVHCTPHTNQSAWMNEHLLTAFTHTHTHTYFMYSVIHCEKKRTKRKKRENKIKWATRFIVAHLLSIHFLLFFTLFMPKTCMISNSLAFLRVFIVNVYCLSCKSIVAFFYLYIYFLFTADSVKMLSFMWHIE